MSIEKYLGRRGKKIVNELNDIKEYGFHCAFCKTLNHVRENSEKLRQITFTDEWGYIISYPICGMCFEFLKSKFGR